MAQINKPEDYFNTKLYTGNGGTQSVTGVGFQPDFTWIKIRNGSAWYILTDAVRGVNSQLYSNDGSVEGTLTNYIQSFDSDGFTLGTNSDVNGSSDTYASWNWLGANTTASNTDGSITSTVSANTTSGFSIVSYTGTGSNATIGHGLGSVPKMIIVKNRDNTEEWKVYHASLGSTLFLRLNSSTGQTSSATYQWNGTTPTSSVFSVGEGNSTNTTDYIAYCFAEKKGFSKFGSYVGNGNADGTFVYTGFKPAFVMVKSIGTEGWYLYDTKRTSSNGGNAVDKYLLANDPIAEGTFGAWDYLSNGFKARQNWSGNNTSGQSYIYMAFAENPLVGTNNIPATAR